MFNERMILVAVWVLEFFDRAVSTIEDSENTSNGIIIMQTQGLIVCVRNII